MISLSCEKSSNHPLYVEGDGVFDSEGNYYETVIIGDQEWMAENLKTDLYCNGDSIQYQDTDVRVKVYDNDPANEEIFGKLYNYQAVLDTSGLCPCGWHVPTELEYAVLINYLGGFKSAMQKMKSVGNLDDGTGLWRKIPEDNEYRGFNSSGFNAIPSGIGFYETYSLRDTAAYFWALSNSPDTAIYYTIGLDLYVAKQKTGKNLSKEVFYYSMRCIKTL